MWLILEWQRGEMNMRWEMKYEMMKWDVNFEMNSKIDQKDESCHCMRWCIEMLNEMPLIYTYIFEHVKILVYVNKEWEKIMLVNWNTWT